MRRKTRNLQPWLDYFSMLQSYEENGFLQMEPEKHEAYLTEAALYSLSPGSENGRGVMRMGVIVAGIPDTVRRLRTYAGWMSREGRSYTDRPFAVHVVSGEASHDLLYTILVSRQRRWWRLWIAAETFEAVSYGERRKP